MADDDAHRTKRCTSCGGSYLLVFFRPSGRNSGTTGLRPAKQHYRDRCIGCEALRKREEPINQHLRRKAEATRRRHGIKLKELGWITDERDLEKMYGWSLDRMIDGIERIKEKGCPYCGQAVDTIGQGLGTITLDIVDADKAPNYVTNVIWCCNSCNSKKQQTPSEAWEKRQNMWRLWRQHQQDLGVNPEAFGFLPFNNSKEDEPTLW